MRSGLQLVGCGLVSQGVCCICSMLERDSRSERARGSRGASPGLSPARWERESTDQFLGWCTKVSVVGLAGAFSLYFVVQTIAVLWLQFNVQAWQHMAYIRLENSLTGVSNETLLALLAVLLAFAGLVSWLFKEVLRGQLWSEFLSIAQAERNASRAEQMISNTVLFGKLHEMTTDGQAAKDKYLKSALFYANHAYEYAAKLPFDQPYRDVILRAKNNFAYGMYKESSDSGKELEGHEVEFISETCRELREHLKQPSLIPELKEVHNDEFLHTCKTVCDGINHTATSERPHREMC